MAETFTTSSNDAFDSLFSTVYAIQPATVPSTILESRDLQIDNPAIATELANAQESINALIHEQLPSISNETIANVTSLVGEAIHTLVNASAAAETPTAVQMKARGISYDVDIGPTDMQASLDAAADKVAGLLAPVLNLTLANATAAIDNIISSIEGSLPPADTVASVVNDTSVKMVKLRTRETIVDIVTGINNTINAIPGVGGLLDPLVQPFLRQLINAGPQSDGPQIEKLSSPACILACGIPINVVNLAPEIPISIKLLNGGP